MKRLSNCGGDLSEYLDSASYQMRMQMLLDRHFMNSESVLEYPWPELDNSIDAVPLIGFGSLINDASASRTITLSGVSKPMIAFGARRLYNYIMSDSSYYRYQYNVPDDHRGVLNVAATGSATDYFNGVLLWIPRKDLEAFRKREYGYDLIRILAVPFDEPDSEPELYFCLSCRQAFFAGRRMLSSGLQPHPIYHNVCEQGCADISTDFLNFFRYSTWGDDALMPVVQSQPVIAQSL